MISAAGFVTQPPQEDLPTASQSTLLLQKKKEMAEVQQQLDRKKEEFRARMQRCQEKEVDLAARQEDIKEQVRKFEKFLKDNDAKRVRADRKVQEERKARDQKENEKLLLLEDLRNLQEGRSLLKAEVEQKGKYQRFLDGVCEDPGEYFESIENIMMRHETLSAAHHDLRTRVDKSQREQEEENQQLINYMKRSQNDLLVYNSEIANKQQELDMRRFRTADGEAALYKGETEAKEGKRELGEIEMAIHNIHNRCVRVRGPPPEGLNGAELQAVLLDAIKQRVVDLLAIVLEIRAARRQAASEALQAANEAAAKGASSSGKPSSGGQGSGQPAGTAISPGSTAGSPNPGGGNDQKPSTQRSKGGDASQSFGQSAGGSGLSGPVSKVSGQIA